MDKVLLVPFSPAAMDYALKVEAFLEQTQQNSSPIFIAVIAVQLFRDLVFLNCEQKTVVAYCSAGAQYVPFDTINKKVSEKPTDHWTLTNLPEEFFEICDDVAHRSGLGSHEDVVLVAIGYVATLIDYVESGMNLFVFQFSGSGMAKLDSLDLQIFESYRPHTLQ